MYSLKIIQSLPADPHSSTVSSLLNWRPHRFKWTRPFRRKTKSGFCACAITFRTSCTDVLEKNSYSRPYFCNSPRIWRPSVSPKYCLLRIRIYRVIRNPNAHTLVVHRHKFVKAHFVVNLIVLDCRKYKLMLRYTLKNECCALNSPLGFSCHWRKNILRVSEFCL